MSEIKLKPCPFCGGRAVPKAWCLPFRAAVRQIITCEDCGAMSWPYIDNLATASEAWNRRAKDE